MVWSHHPSDGHVNLERIEMDVEGSCLPGRQTPKSLDTNGVTSDRTHCLTVGRRFKYIYKYIIIYTLIYIIKY